MSNIIRTLGLYQPYAGLMLPPWNKIETRWVRAHRKPPFPLGKYLIYSCLKSYHPEEVDSIAGNTINDELWGTIANTEVFNLCGFAIGIGDLVEVRKMEPVDQEKAFVKVDGDILSRDLCYTIEDGDTEELKTYIRYCLIFKNMQRIKPFHFKGKQGIGFLNEADLKKIDIIH